MATLTNTKIKDTYDGLLKTTDNEALDVSGVTLIEDGLGNASALSVGRSGNGVTITGSLNATLATAAQPNITSVGTLSSLSVSGNLAVDTNTLYVDAANNRVGVGTSTLSAPLDVRRGDTDGVVAEFHNSTGYGIDVGSSTTDAYISSGYLQNFIFKTNSGSGQTERMRIDSSGNVGIGLTPNTSYSRLQIKATDSVYALDLIGRNAGTEGEAQITFWNSAQSTVQGYITQDNGNMLFGAGIGASERMRITSDGYVGVGTGNTNVLSGDLIGVLAFNSKDSSTNSSGAIGSIRSYATASFNTGQVSGDLRFYTQDSGSPNGSLLSGSERMRITSGGYLKASSTGSYLNASGAYHELFNNAGGNQVLQASTEASTNPYGIGIKFTAASPNNTTLWFLRAEDSTNAKFYVYSNGNVVNTNNSYGAISDAKLKENVVDASPKLDDLLQVKVRNFNYIGDDKKQLGVVAQELEEVFPSMIDESPDFEEQEVIDEEGNVTKERVDLGTTTKSVKYSVFVPMLIKAIQELNAKVAALESQLNA